MIEIPDREFERLRQNEELYRTLAESSQDFIFIIDGEMKIHYVNKYAVEQIGLTQEKVMGKNLIDFMPTVIYERAKWDIQRVLDSGQPFVSESMVPLGDRQLWLETQLIPLKEFGGEQKLVLGISRDMTKYKTAEDRLRGKMRNLEDFNRAVVSKELRLIELEKEVLQLKKCAAKESNLQP
ncbi:MAG: PAS domain S-box protein [Candidatus Margulisiibacteriota bacterium]